MKYLGKVQEAKDLVNVQYVSEVDSQIRDDLNPLIEDNSQAIAAETQRATAAETGLLGASSDGEDATTIYGARKLASIAQNLAQNAQASIGNMSLSEVSASTGQVIGTISQTDGKVNADVKTLSADDIPQIPQSKVTDLTTALSGKQDTIVFQNNNYDPETNKAITNSDLQAALGGLSAISASIVVNCSTWSGSSFVVSNTFFNNITDSDTVIVAPAPEDLVFAAEYGIYVNSISSGQATLYRTKTSAWQSSTLALNFLVIKGS